MKSNLPVLLLKNMVLFPYNEIRLEFENDNDKKLISLSESCYENNILIVNPKDSLESSPEIDELPNYGIVGKIKMKLDMPNGKTRIILLGENRVRIYAYSKDDGLYEALYSNAPIEEMSVKEEIAYTRALNKHIDVYVKEIPYMSNTILSQTAGINSIEKLTDIIVLYLPINYERKKEYLKEFSSTSRVKMILDDINKDIEIMRLEQKIEATVANGLDQTQKEFVLREKIKAIREELGEEEQNEVETLRDKINKLECPKKVKEKLLVELNKYSISNFSSPETGMIRNYIEWLINLPWNNYTDDRKDLNKVREILDSTHYGLDNVKDRVIEYLAVKQNTDNLRSPIICLVGPPGVGKTTFAKNIAKSLNRKVTKISVGGINDEAEIIGHRRAYIGAAPGLIIQGMKRAGTKNPVFIIDEIDKMTKDIKGDPASSLLEVLDKEQNKYFVDHYLEEEFDRSPFCTPVFEREFVFVVGDGAGSGSRCDVRIVGIGFSLIEVCVPGSVAEVVGQVFEAFELVFRTCECDKQRSGRVLFVGCAGTHTHALDVNLSSGVGVQEYLNTRADAAPSRFGDQISQIEGVCTPFGGWSEWHDGGCYRVVI